LDLTFALSRNSSSRDALLLICYARGVGTPDALSAEQTLLSIIIPARNAQDWIGELLEALIREVDSACEVLLADNGSTDGTNDLFRNYANAAPTRWSIVDASAVPGTAYARNLGAQEASGDLLLFVDADDVVAPGYVAAMRDALAEHEFVVASLDCDTLNPAWTKPKVHGPQVREIPIVLGFLPAGAGGSLGIRRSLFERLDGFDTTSLIEDADLCWRAQLKGIDLTFVPDAVLRFRYRNSLGAFFRRGLRDGLGRPALYATFRDLGMPRRDWRTIVSFYGGVLPMFWRTRTRADLADLCATLGVRLGLVAGCVKYRVWYL
jgi:glycosyltransferase involved in cell wall biosynthesis